MKQLRIPETTSKRKTALLILAAILLFAATTASSQTYSVLYNLTVNSADPFSPEWLGLYAQARDGNLYSTSQNGGAFGHGAIFQLTPAGKVKVLHSFAGADGSVPRGGLTLGTDGSLYGTTCTGGSANAGTVFKITTAGVYTVLHHFLNTTDGLCPEAPPIQGRDGNFYGTTTQANATVGSVYKMTPAGTLTRLFVFDPAHGETPTAITLGTDGNFYGTTRFGGASNDGTVFKITPQGKFTLLHSFNGTDGLDPLGPITQASDGNFYGTTFQARSIYKMTPAGVVTSLHGFGTAEGSHPTAGLIQATDGKLYGAAIGGGSGFGTLFQVTLTGTFTLLHDFDGVDGWAPQVTMFQHTSGPFYGSTNAGGTSSKPGGVLYKLGMGLKPFVALVTPFGRVGQVVEILGNGLTGTSSVKFGTAAASFTVVSDTYLTAAIPSGATTGFVTVATPGGVLTSNRKFLVIPQITSFSPTSGAVGASVTITGVSLKQTTKVTFGGVKATTFTVNSDTKVTAIVPSGAVTGKIAITTLGGTAVSSGTFTVTLPSPLAITSGAPPSGTVGTLYFLHCLQIPPCNVFAAGYPLSAMGGVQPYSWTWNAQPGSSLPPGLTIGGGCLNTPPPTICGKPTTAGSYNVVVTVRDSESPAMQNSANYTIVINP